MKKMKMLCLFVFWIVAISSLAQAAPVNIDFGSKYGAPPNTYGAASGQTGTWNDIRNLGITSNLFDLDGNSTTVNITISAETITGSSYYPGDAGLIVSDNFYVRANNSWNISLTNLNNGIYDVYLYMPHNIAVDTGAGNVNGISFTNISGDFGGTFIQGTNYHLLTGVTITDGTLSATGSTSSFSGLAGIQITPAAVPIPSGIFLMASAVVGLIGIRRKLKN